MSYDTDALAVAVMRILQEFSSGSKGITITKSNGAVTNIRMESTK